MTINPRLLALSTVVIAAAGLLIGAGGPAAADPGALATGRVTVYSTSTFTGTATTIAYTGCRSAAGRSIARVGSYANSPLPGCQVVLRNRTGAQHVLCAGRAVVPQNFRVAPRLIIRAGATKPCPVRMSA